jgi:amidase
VDRLPARPRSAGPTDALAQLDGIAQAKRVARGELSAVELIQAAMRRSAALDPTLNAIVTPSFDRALARAAAAPATGPFAGVPYLLKDLMDWQGVRCTRGSRLYAGEISKRSPRLVQRSEATGLVILGKTNTSEFGLLPSTESLALGVCRNPWDPLRSAGGSSGGAAAAVAAGIVALAQGGDGGGSIRIPASCCGVFGLKPSRGRVEGDGASAAEISVNHCLSRSVRDSALLLSLTERTAADAALPALGFVGEPNARRLRIAFSTRSYFGEEPDPEVKAATEAAAQLCAELGHETIEAEPQISGAEFADHFLTVWAHGPARLVEQLESDPASRGKLGLLEPWTLGLAEDFRRKPLGSLEAALAYFAEVGRVVDAFFDRVEVWLTPVVAELPPLLGEFGPELPFETLRERCVRYVSYTPVHNVAGTPAMSVPLAWSQSGLPIGTQFAARRGGEATLLELAYELEAARPWRARWPALAALGA